MARVTRGDCKAEVVADAEIRLKAENEKLQGLLQEYTAGAHFEALNQIISRGAQSFLHGQARSAHSTWRCEYKSWSF
jgi:hypothetical protein